MIWIRCDANSEIGMGHIMRCLSVADALEKLGEQVYFILADAGAKALLESKGKDYFVLQTDYHHMESELPVFSAKLQEERPNLLLIDSYGVTSDYLVKVRKYVATAYMDDQFLFPYPVDILINYNIYGEILPYRQCKELKDAQLLLGTSFAPLRKEFQNVTYEIRDQVKNVLVTTGGSDKYNLAGRILEATTKEDALSSVMFHVVSGAFNMHFTYLQEMEKQYSNICIHQNVTDMADLMKQCDIAITAGGSTMYELCAVGVPVLCFSFIDNQEQIVQSFTKRDIVPYGGNYLLEGDKLPQKIMKQLILLLKDNKERYIYSKRERMLVDGRGAEKLASALYAYVEKHHKM